MPDGKQISNLKNQAIESAVISLLLKLTLEKLLEVSIKLKVEDFGVKINACLYAIILKLIDEEKDINTLNIIAELKSMPRMYKELGDDEKAYDTLEALKLVEVNEEDIDKYIDEIKKYKVCRDMIGITNNMVQQIYNEAANMDLNQVLNLPEKLYINVINDNPTESISIGDNLRKYINKKPEEINMISGIPSKYECFNRYLHGYKPGWLYCISSKIHGGKSTFLNNEANYITTDLGIDGLYLDSENLLSQIEIMNLSIRTGLEPDEIELGTFLNDSKKAKIVEEEISKLENSKLRHMELIDYNTDFIKRIVRYHIQKYHIKILFFDYIKVPSSDGNDGLLETLRIKNLTNYLKNSIAKELNIPVLTSAQNKSDDALADSKWIEGLVDVWGILRDRKDENLGNVIYGEKEIEFRKKRGGNGKFPTMYFKFDGVSNNLIEGDNSHLYRS